MNDADRRLMEFEANHPERGVLKANAVIRELGMKPVRYEQRMQAIARMPEALAEFPMVIHRLERAAQEQASLRTHRRLA